MPRETITQPDTVSTPCPLAWGKSVADLHACEWWTKRALTLVGVRNPRSQKIAHRLDAYGHQGRVKSYAAELGAPTYQQARSERREGRRRAGG
jgi:hypothetical protein